MKGLALSEKVKEKPQRNHWEVKECVNLGWMEKCGNKSDLEGDDANPNHAQPELGKGILATQETRVEESDARNHNPDESGRGEDPGDVTEVEDGIAVSMSDEVLGWGEALVRRRKKGG
jgi:hypothetical protein